MLRQLLNSSTWYESLQSRRSVLLYAGGAVAAVAGLTALLKGGSSDSFGEVDGRERASIGVCKGE
jgi:hypothetical protein